MKEFSKKYDDKKPITNVELRNYVMLRYAVDYPNEFPTIAIPTWKVKDGVTFAATFKLVNTILMKDPESLGELKTHQEYKQGGRVTKSKNPGSYVYYNSESKPDDLLGRLAILFNVLTNVNDTEQGKFIADGLLESEVVVEVDDARMLTLEEIYIKNPNDSRGTPIPVSQLSSKKFDRGHKVAKSKGGKNDELIIQPIRENRQTQDDYVV